MYIRVLPFLFSVYKVYCCSCCSNGTSYKEISVDISSSYPKLSLSSVQDACKKVVTSSENNSFQCLKYIEYREITLQNIKVFTCTSNWDQCKLDRLKKQIDFLNIVSYPYYIDFILRLINDNVGNKIKTSFVVSFGGSGRAIHWPSAYNIRKVSSKYFPIVEDDVSLEGDARYSCLPILVGPLLLDKNLRNGFKFFYPGIFIDNNAYEKQFMYCRMVLNYLMQCANPIFYICNNAIEATASMYNVALMLKDIFKIDVDDYFHNGVYSQLDVASSEGFKSRETIKSLLSSSGACEEKDVIMLAGVIALNNLLYKVFNVAKGNNMSVNCILGFESYSGRVWEMLIALWLKEYDGLLVRDEVCCMQQNSLKCVLTHCLIGSNKLFYNEATIGNRQQVLIKVSEILKGLANGEGLGEDRMDYLDCEQIFGVNIKDLLLYWKKLTCNPTIQVISQIVDNEGSGISGFFKHIFSWSFDRVLASYYASPYNDGMLSDQGLFFYHDNFKDYSSLPFVQNSSGCKYVTDEELNIKYIVVGAGRHLDNKRWKPYDKQASRVYSIIDAMDY